MPTWTKWPSGTSGLCTFVHIQCLSLMCTHKHVYILSYLRTEHTQVEWYRQTHITYMHTVNTIVHVYVQHVHTYMYIH